MMLSVVNNGRKQSATSSSGKEQRPVLPSEKFYWRSAAYNYPDMDMEEEYKGRFQVCKINRFILYALDHRLFQCEWDGCDDVLPSNVSFVNHMLAHFLNSPIKFNSGD